MIKPLDNIFSPQITPLEELCEIFARGYLRLIIPEGGIKQPNRLKDLDTSRMVSDELDS